MDIQQSEKVLSLQLEWVKAADGKVPPIFAINVAMLAVMAALLPQIKTWEFWSVTLPTASTVFLLVSILFLGMAMFPRLAGPIGSHVFFGQIALLSEDNYVDSALKLPNEDYQTDLLRQTHRNAQIALTKYEHVRSAVQFSFIATPFWLSGIYAMYG